MPDRSWTRGNDRFTVMRTLDGHRAKRHHYDDLGVDETYEMLDARRNPRSPSTQGPESEDRTSYELDDGGVD